MREARATVQVTRAEKHQIPAKEGTALTLAFHACPHQTGEAC